MKRTKSEKRQFIAGLEAGVGLATRDERQTEAEELFVAIEAIRDAAVAAELVEAGGTHTDAILATIEMIKEPDAEASDGDGDGDEDGS